jgi:hypothetical protein
MRIFGWIYIIIFSIGAVLGLVTALAPGIQGISSSIISILVIILSILVFILACMGKLKPRKIFLFLSGYYFLTIIYGIVVGVLMVIKLGTETVMSGEATPDLLRETFTWFGPVSWILIIASLLLSIYGIVGYLKRPEATEQPISSD